MNCKVRSTAVSWLWEGERRNEERVIECSFESLGISKVAVIYHVTMESFKQVLFLMIAKVFLFYKILKTLLLPLTPQSLP